ncbi:root UVB sensitive family, partial [Chytriomyces sp. MP71]
FLPVGYPDSVSGDYTVYQMYDSLQACCSALTGVLATRAAFKRAGVGDATANASAATLVWILQDLTGMIGRILYAWRVSFLLDADCKQFRFYADILNDSALFIEVLSPMFLPREWFTLSACIATLLKSLCGVTGGATKAALSQHFAIRDNMADLHAKEGSQETVVGLVGLLLGSALMQLVPDDSIVLTWTFFVLFTSLHLVCNYRGICAIVMPSLNTQRAFLVIRHYLESLPTNTQIQNENDGFLTPLQVANRESIF